MILFIVFLHITVTLRIRIHSVSIRDFLFSSMLLLLFGDSVSSVFFQCFGFLSVFPLSICNLWHIESKQRIICNALQRTPIGPMNGCVRAHTLGNGYCDMCLVCVCHTQTEYSQHMFRLKQQRAYTPHTHTVCLKHQ